MKTPFPDVIFVGARALPSCAVLSKTSLDSQASVLPLCSEAGAKYDLNAATSYA